MIQTNFIKRLTMDIPLMDANLLAFMLSRTHSADDLQMAEHPMFKKMRGDMKPQMERMKNMAIVPVQGALAYNPDVGEMVWDGVEDSRNVQAMLQEASDDDEIEGVLLRMDTPGGMMMGGPEMADTVAQMKSRKPVIAHIGGLGASLGYMIASQATEVIANRSAVVGSIGVIASITDYSALLDKLGIKFQYFTNKEAKYKAAGAIGTSLTDDQKTQIQSQVDSAFQIFKGMVLSARPGVPDSAMQGQTFRGGEAKQVGLVDRVGNESFAIGVLKSYMKK
ncbi:MAG: S49 family peptidase [Patescibacteria group bacterium]|nr:S49 family peptidase [Patescibacteria group bacterium]